MSATNESRLVLALLLLLTSAGQLSSQDFEDSSWRQFHGEHHPTAYLSRLMATANSWFREHRQLFLERSIEASKWLKPGQNNQLIQSDQQMRDLALHFPILTGQPLESGTTRRIGELLAGAYPDVAGRVTPTKDINRRFHRMPSPSFFFERRYRKSGVLSSSEWKIVLRLLEEATAWEKANPEQDYGIGPESPFLVLVKRRYPTITLESGPLGVTCTELLKAVKRVTS